MLTGLLAVVILAAEPQWVPGVVSGVASSATFGGLALYVIGRLWKSLDEERAARAREQERDLANQERMIAALLEAADGFRRSTDLLARMEVFLR